MDIKTEIRKRIRDVESTIYYNSLVVCSLEAKTKRIEPLSDEFEKTVSLLIERRKLARDLALERLKLTQQLWDIDPQFSNCF